VGERWASGGRAVSPGRVDSGGARVPRPPGGPRPAEAHLYSVPGPRPLAGYLPPPTARRPVASVSRPHPPWPVPPVQHPTGDFSASVASVSGL
jgi:hypothetical protein